jgi:4-aminobutyrate aminotransferase
MGNLFFAPYPNSYRPIIRSSMIDEDYLDLLEGVYTHETTGNVAAVLVESIQGNSGQIIPTINFMKKLEKWCRDREILLIADETQTAFGRCGKWFCFEHYGIKPDLIICGKGLSSGFPITALLGEENIFDACPQGTFSSTHGGNPISTMGALSSINIIEEENLLSNSNKMGKILLDELNNLKEKYDFIGDVRGMGLMIGIEIVKDKLSKSPEKELAKKIVNKSIENGLLLIQPIGFHKNIIRMAPPLIMNEVEIRKGLQIFEEVLREI